MMGFFLAMVLHPRVQKAAQEELDRVVGYGAFADISQRDDLPYLNALLNETLRWHQSLPLGTQASEIDENYES